MTNGRYTLYPETRFVSEENLRMALMDDIANKECPNAELTADEASKLSLDEVCKLLDEHFTFAAPTADVSALRDRAKMEAAMRVADYEP